MPLKGRNYVFAKPTLIAEIEFRGWTDHGNLRHASYIGLREIQDNAAVYELDWADSGGLCELRFFVLPLLNLKFSKTKWIAVSS